MIAGAFDDPAVRRWPSVLEILRCASDPKILSESLGRHALDGDRVYFLLSEYETHAAAKTSPETHRVYCDVQVILSGEERIGWAPLSEAFSPRGPYDEGKDLQLHDGGEPLTFLVARPGRFFLFAPADAHQAGVVVAGPAPVRKMVGKVRRTLLDL